MIIMSTRGMGRVTELPLGSTAESVVRGSNIPVLLIPRVYLRERT